MAREPRKEGSRAGGQGKRSFDSGLCSGSSRATTLGILGMARQSSKSSDGGRHAWSTAQKHVWQHVREQGFSSSFPSSPSRIPSPNSHRSGHHEGSFHYYNDDSKDPRTSAIRGFHRLGSQPVIVPRQLQHQGMASIEGFCPQQHRPEL